MQRHIKSDRSQMGIGTWYILEGDKGAVAFYLLRMKLDVSPVYNLCIHSRVPQHADHESMGPCLYTGDDECYFTTDAVAGDILFRRFDAEGEDPESIWRLLKERYDEHFA